VIIGKLIPAGSGIAQRRREQIARQQQAAARLTTSSAVESVGVGAGAGSGATIGGMVLDSPENE
jgi:DNA-directed RNA polymerase subunit beta'